MGGPKCSVSFFSLEKEGNRESEGKEENRDGEDELIRAHDGLHVSVCHVTSRG